MEKMLGKIESVYFGIGGYQDAQLGLHMSFSGGAWGVGWSESVWDPETIKHTEHTQWTEESRDKQLADLCRQISKYLKEAKVNSVDKLKGVPVEVTFEGNTIKSWRILTEVI